MERRDLLKALAALRAGGVRVRRYESSRDKIETTNGGPYRTFEPARTSTLTLYLEHRQ